MVSDVLFASSWSGPLLALYTNPGGQNAQRYRQTDGETDGETGGRTDGRHDDANS